MLHSLRNSAKYISWFVAVIMLVWVGYSLSGLGTTGALPSNVAKVDGTPITALAYDRAVRSQVEQEQQQGGRTVSLDQERQIGDRVLQEMVDQVLLEREYTRRGIVVTEDEIRQAAAEQPYPALARSSEFQTEGRFDMQKYQRYLASPAAKQQGLLAFLDDYYRQALLKAKLFEQLATPVYASDAQLWRLWTDTRDSARVTFVALGADLIADSAVTVTDAEIAEYFAANKKDFADRPGRAVVTVARLPRVVSASDSAAALAKATALRAEIQKGAKFADVAKRESQDTLSAAQGGSLGKTARGAFVPAFENAAYALKVGQVSAPVLTQFGYHLILVEARAGDSLTARHILVRIHQGDSAATATDRRADQLAKAAAASRPAIFDSAVAQLGLQRVSLVTYEGTPLSWTGRIVAGANAWAFDGAKPGEVGELIDTDDAYYLVRLDSLAAGGKPTLETMRTEIRAELARGKKLDVLMPRAQLLSSAAVKSGATLESAASALGYVAVKSDLFARTSQVPGLGQANQAIGAAFGLPVGQVSAPIRSRTAVVVERVDVRHAADSAAWAKQLPLQRDQVQQRVREQAIQQFVVNLRQQATITDNRKELHAAQRQPTS